jgi:signal transduction histidine kinase
MRETGRRHDSRRPVATIGSTIGGLRSWVDIGNDDVEHAPLACTCRNRDHRSALAVSEQVKKGRVRPAERGVASAASQLVQNARMSAIQAPSSRRVESVLWATVFSLYLFGLVVWLGLGLIPPLTDAIGPLKSLLEWLASTSSPLSGIAQRVLDEVPALPHPGLFVLQYAFSIVNLSLGVLLAVRRPHDVVPRLLAVALIGTAATFNRPSHVVYTLIGQPLPVKLLHTSFHVVSGLAYLLAVVMFPDGRFPISLRLERTRTFAFVEACGVALIAVGLYATRLYEHTPLLVIFFGVVVSASGFAAQTWRIRSPELTPALRQQSRLLRAALVPAFVVAVTWLIARGSSFFGTTDASSVDEFVQLLFPLVFAVVPVVLLAAILKYRMWDLDVVLSRALLIVLMGAFVAVTYAVVLATAGVLLRGRGWSAALAMVVVALAVEPLARRCEHLANRLVFGQELTPRQAMRELATRLEHPTASSELDELTRILVVATRCSRADVWLLFTDTLVLAAHHPEPRSGGPPRIALQGATLSDAVRALPGTHCVPVMHEGELIAVIALTLPTGVTLPRAELRLVRDLARHAGLLVANARLTADLARQVELVETSAAELRRSREQVVVAQDAERCRLERDIHDGAQQELVALLIELGMANRIAVADGVLPSPRVEQLRHGIGSARAAVDDLRHGGGPRLLTAEGLPGAVQAMAVSARRTGLVVDCECNLSDRLPPEIESATYFCCLEALQNIEKHSRATRAVVSVRVVDDDVVFCVSDNGVGISASHVSGHSGLAHLAERATALGGRVEIESGSARGTAIRGRIPVVRALAREVITN